MFQLNYLRSAMAQVPSTNRNGYKQCFRPRFCTVIRPGTTIAEHELLDEPHPSFRINRFTCWSAAQYATTVLRLKTINIDENSSQLVVMEDSQPNTNQQEST